MDNVYLDITSDVENDEDGPAECGGCAEIFPESHLRNGICADCEREVLTERERQVAADVAEILRAFNEEMEEEDAEDGEPPADKFERRDGAILVKPTGPCVEIEAHDGVSWRV